MRPKQCVYPSQWTSNKHTLLEDWLQLSIQIYPIFYPQSQHGRIKSWVRGSSGVWPAITYAPVIWLYWLWAACCATLLGLGNIKLIIAIDRQSICQHVELGGWADALSASFPLPSLKHLCIQLPEGAALASRWAMCLFLFLYPLGMQHTQWTYSSILSIFCHAFPQLASPERKLVFKYRKQLALQL